MDRAEIGRISRQVFRNRLSRIRGRSRVCVTGVASTWKRGSDARQHGRMRSHELNKKKPPPLQVAASIWNASSDLVHAIPGLGLRGLDLETVLLGGGREEAPDRMFLPIRGFHDLG